MMCCVLVSRSFLLLLLSAGLLLLILGPYNLTSRYIYVYIFIDI